MCVCVCARVLTGRFQCAVTNVDVNRSARQNRVVARCKEEEEKSSERRQENTRARERGPRSLTVLAGVWRRREDVEVVVQTSLVET